MLLLKSGLLRCTFIWIFSGMTLLQAQTLKDDTLSEILVDIGYHKLFVTYKRIPGSRITVIFESGGGGTSKDWDRVKALLPADVSTLTYDRAGSGKSEKGPLPRTMAQEVYELHQLIKTLKIKGPLVLVGQSVGGLNMRMYARKYANDVKGLVLVDPTHESGMLGSMKYGGWVRLREKSTGKAIPKPQLKNKESEGYDEQADYMAEEFREMYEYSLRNPQPLKNKLLIVIGAGKRNQPPGTPDEQWKQIRTEREQQIRDLTSLSLNSEFIPDPKSGHMVHFDNPEIVAEAVVKVIRAVLR